MKRYRFAFVWFWVFVAGASIWSCTPTGKTPVSSELCIQLSDGASKCLPFGGDSILLLEIAKEGLQVSSQSAKGLVASPQNGNPSDAAALAEGLLKSQAAFSFDPKQEKIKWEKNQLIIESAKGDLPKRIYKTDNVMSIMLLQPDKLGAAYGGFIGMARCDSFFDVDHLVDSVAKARGTDFVAFMEISGVYYAGYVVDGGLTIIVVDPTIIDGDWRAGSGFRLTNDFGFESWRAERTGISARALNSHFVKSEHLRPDFSVGSGAVYAMASSGSSTDADVRRRFEGIDFENGFDLVCKIQGDVQIELCDSAFHFWQTPFLMQEIPQFPCTIGIRRVDGVTSIYKPTDCDWPDLSLPCAR